MTMPAHEGAPTVLIADDHPLVRVGIRRFLESQAFMVVGEASDGRNAVETWEQHRPAVTLMDLDMPRMDGLEATKAICAYDRAARILLTSASDRRDHSVRAARAGARGLFSKASPPHVLAQALRDVLDGALHFPNHPSITPHAPLGVERLSDRELQVLTLLARGATTREAAEQLYISVKTVDTHRQRLLKKLGLRNNAELALFAVRNDIIAP